MKRRCLGLLVLAAAGALFASLAEGHGSGGGGGGGIGRQGNGPPPPFPRSAIKPWLNPSTGAPTSPRSPGAGIPASPTSPSSAPSAPGAGGLSTTAGSFLAPDYSSWTFWWGYNRDAFLNLKRSIWEESPVSGPRGFYLGHGDRGGVSVERLRPSDELLREKVAPALLETLRTETSRSIVTSCLIALGQMGELSIGDDTLGLARTFREYLPHSNQTISETAVVALGLLRNPSVLPALTALLEDGEDGRRLCSRSEVPVRTRAFAALGLGLVGERSENEDVRRYVVYHLVNALDRDDTPSAELGIAAVTALGMVALPEGIEGAGMPASAGLGAQVDYMAALLADTRRGRLVRAHAARALARLAGPSDLTGHKEVAAGALLQELRRNGEREIRYGCVLALGLLGDTDADAIDRSIRGALEKAASDRDVFTRNFALVASAQVAGRPGRNDVAAATEAVRRDLLSRLGKGKRTSRPWAGIALGVMGYGLAESGAPSSAEVSAALLQTLRETKSPEEAGAYAIGLGLLRDPEAEALLLEKLRSFDDDLTRGQISLAVGMAGGIDSVPVLRSLLRESLYRPAFLRQAAVGLALLGDKGVVPELMDIMRTSESSAVKAAVASVMGYVGDSRAVDPLVEMLTNQQLVDRSRALAAVALGHVADRDPIPWTTVVAMNIDYPAYSEILNSADQTGLLNMR